VARADVREGKLEPRWSLLEAKERGTRVCVWVWVCEDRRDAVVWVGEAALRAEGWGSLQCDLGTRFGKLLAQCIPFKRLSAA
jgi:hypothetical protein